MSEAGRHALAMLLKTLPETGLSIDFEARRCRRRGAVARNTVETTGELARGALDNFVTGRVVNNYHAQA